MPASDDVTRWISGLAVGDEDAAQVLWEKYFVKLVQYARRKLHDAPLRTFDEEDVALSAMFSFCRGMEAGRFERVEGRARELEEAPVSEPLRAAQRPRSFPRPPAWY